MSAFTFNVPVIATRVGGLPDMLVMDVLECLLTKKNSKELSDAIVCLLENKKCLASL